MGGGLIQLVSKGQSDTYITGNPQFSYFKSVYRRHTNFSIESIQQSFKNTGQGTKIISTISREGDLLCNMWLDVKLDRGNASSTGNETGRYVNWTNNTGHALIKECEIEIGGKTIEKHTSQWLDIYNEIYDHDEKEWIGLNKHAAKNLYLTSGSPNNISQILKLYIPLHFWFTKNPGLALPLVGLSKHDVNLIINLRETDKLFNTSNQLIFTKTDPVIDLWCDYVFLDKEEQMRFIGEKKAYLIEQVQTNELKMQKRNQIHFFHPVKEIFWVNQNNNVKKENGTGSPYINATLNSPSNLTNTNDYFNYQASELNDNEFIYGYDTYESFKTAKLEMNNIDRFDPRDASYFRLCQPIQNKHKIPTKKIYNYSFALNPEDHQPSGTCNFSKLDDVYLIFTSGQSYQNQTLNVYAINYNVLIISSGMGGLVYK
jgi:hypothetical protein